MGIFRKTEPDLGQSESKIIIFWSGYAMLFVAHSKRRSEKIVAYMLIKVVVHLLYRDAKN